MLKQTEITTPNYSVLAHNINTSSLSSSDKENLLLLFMRASDEELKDIALLSNEIPSFIEKLNQNFKTKKMALEEKSISMWKDAITQETTLLENMLME